jgi:amino acid transporter
LGCTAKPALQLARHLSSGGKILVRDATAFNELTSDTKQPPGTSVAELLVVLVVLLVNMLVGVSVLLVVALQLTRHLPSEGKSLEQDATAYDELTPDSRQTPGTSVVVLLLVMVVLLVNMLMVAVLQVIAWPVPAVVVPVVVVLVLLVVLVVVLTQFGGKPSNVAPTL